MTNETVQKAIEVRNTMQSLANAVAYGLVPYYFHSVALEGPDTQDTVQSKVRKAINGVSLIEDSFSKLTVVKDWEVGLTTAPGDMVYDPDKKYIFVYSGESLMTHSNPEFYPGAQGVYYWEVIPKAKDCVKIYPDINVTVAVTKDEIWWDPVMEHKWRWLGADNNNCVWPPQEGNEWELVE